MIKIFFVINKSFYFCHIMIVMNKYHKYLKKYKEKYHRLKIKYVLYGGQHEKYPVKNKFYYIDKYKQDIVYIIGKYMFKKNIQKLNDFFVIWYIDADKH